MLATALLTSLFFASCEKENYISAPGNLVPKTVEQDASLPSISVNGTQFHTETFGNPDSAMLVVLHGGPGSDYRYLLNCKTFADEGYFVVFYDQRGSGLSKRHDKGVYDLQIMLDDLEAVVAHYRRSPNQKVFLLGHSWGAILATAYINAYPTRIDGAILGEPGGFVWDDITAYVERSREYRFTGEALNDALYSDQFITGNEEQHEILDYKYALLAAAEETDESLIGNEGPLPFWRSGAVVNTALFDYADKNGFDATTHLSQFSTKVLFLYSERNQAYGLQHAQKVASAYPNVQLERINGAGHDMISFPTGWQNVRPLASAYLNSLKQ